MKYQVIRVIVGTDRVIAYGLKPHEQSARVGMGDRGGVIHVTRENMCEWVVRRTQISKTMCA